MNYNQAVSYIENCYKRKGSIYTLESIQALIAALGSPHGEQRIIHIAGTNGKGSVGAFIGSCAKEAGYRAGRFVSPVVYDYRERFTVNGKSISREDFARVITHVASAAETIGEYKNSLTGFELEAAAALCYFNTEHCDLSIIECGLGGERDATNAIDNPLLAVLTSISLDHTDVLGDTIEEITREKCGIIKKGCSVVSAKQQPEAEKIIAERCRSLNVSCSFAENEKIESLGFNGLAQSFSYKNYRNMEMNMAGAYQRENAALALEAVEALNQRGFSISDEAARRGIKNTLWRGRFEILSRDPLFIADGAHNPDGAKRLRESLDLYFKGKKMLFIIGVFADKDYEGMLKATAPIAEKIFAFKPSSPRGLEACKLRAAAERYNDNVAEGELREAVQYCMARKDCITVAFGSLSFMAELSLYIKEYQNG